MLNYEEDIRPDKILEKRLLLLVFMLTATIVSIGFLFAYPTYLRPIIGAIFIFIILSIHLAINILQLSEPAILYGGMVNEILKNRKISYMIINRHGKIVLQNQLAKTTLQNKSILSFIKANIIKEDSNLQKLQELELSLKHLKEKSLELPLRFDNTKIFSSIEWYKVTIRPISLSQSIDKQEDNHKDEIQLDNQSNIYLLWSLENITSEKTMDNIFQEERRSYYNFINFIPIGIYTVNNQNKITYINKTLSDILHTPKEDLLGKDITQFLPQSSLDCTTINDNCKQYTSYVLHNGELTEYLIKTDSFKEGAESITRGSVIGNIPTDKNLKASFEEAISQFYSIFNLSPFGMVLLDNDLVIKSTNQRFIEILEIPSSSQLQNNYMSNYLDEASMAKIQKQLNNFRISNDCLQPAFFDLNIQNKGKSKTLRIFVCPLFSSSIQIYQNIKGVVLFCQDTTERKNLESQFAQAQKMQAMGQLAGGIAHDFNNLLTAMIGFCDLLLQKHSIGDSSFADIIQIKQNATCAAELVKQLLQFSRKQSLTPELSDITDILNNYTPLLKRTVGEQVDLRFNHGTNLDYIKVDKVQFLQVILNLCVNAKDAMNKKGILTITTQNEALLEPYHFGAETIEKGNFLRIDVSDSGCGIPLENLSRIFEPFFSTKQNVVGSGTGLGLATVYGIVRQMEGFIKVTSTIDKGTTFSVYLPSFHADITINKPEQTINKTLNDKKGRAVLTPTPTQLTEDKLILGLSINNNEEISQTPENIENIRILFVDDENSLRTFALRALRKKGYNVVGCSSAENALEQLEEDKNFQLLITDMVMPGLNGIELSEQVKEMIPDIKIILASGYSEDILEGEFTKVSNLSFIPKPFSLNDLTQKVYEVLKS